MTILLMLTSDNHIKKLDGAFYATASELENMYIFTVSGFIERLKSRKLGDTSVIAAYVKDEKDLNHIMDLWEQVELRLSVEQKLKDLEPKVERWEPREFEKNYIIDNDGEVRLFAATMNELRLFGNEFETKENAEEQRDRIRKMNIMFQYALEYDGYSNKGSWYVYFDGREGRYITSAVGCNIDLLTIITMSRDCAIQLANDLNSGRVVL